MKTIIEWIMGMVPIVLVGHEPFSVGEFEHIEIRIGEHHGHAVLLRGDRPIAVEGSLAQRLIDQPTTYYSINGYDQSIAIEVVKYQTPAGWIFIPAN